MCSRWQTAGKLAAIDKPKMDGYTVTYTSGVVVYGARPRSLLFAAGEPHHWATPRTTSYHRNPEFALRNATYHPDYPVAEQAAIFGANFFVANLPASPALQALPEVFGALGADDQKRLVRRMAQRHKVADNAAQACRKFKDADVDVYARCCPTATTSRTWSYAWRCMRRC